MGYANVKESVPLPGSQTGGVAFSEEIIIGVVKSAAGAPVTVLAGDVMVVDPVVTGGLKHNAVKRCDATTAYPIGIALENVTVPGTTAIGDLHYEVKMLRRGYHPAVRVTAAAASTCLVPSATTGQGTGVAPGAVTAVQAALVFGFTIEAVAANLVAANISMP